MKTIKIRKGEYKATIGNMSVLIVKDEIHGGWNSYDADTDDWMGSADTKTKLVKSLKNIA
jgi:hypothetical protein